MSFKIYCEELPKKYRQNKCINANKLMPNDRHRTCIVSASSSGKTNILMNPMKESKTFHKVYLYTKKLDESLYQNILMIFMI